MIATMPRLKILLIFSFSFFAMFNMEGQIGNVIGKYSPRKNVVSKNKALKHNQKKILARTITKDITSDREKVRAIYKWITSNISYDNRLRNDEALQRQIYISEDNIVENVLEREMALCGGYAFLFRDLCAEVGISAEVVHGYSKDFTGRPRSYKQPNHTWNVVKLDGQWRLLDITWAIGYGAPGNTDDFWFMTEPKSFIYSHYPEDPKWTLLKNPISFAAFKK